MKPLAHQSRAIRKAVSHYKKNRRGKLIHPTGTGKSLTALWISGKIKSETTLIVLPSIGLVAQTLRTWKEELPKASYIAICSDQNVADDDVGIEASGIDVEVTTDPKQLRKFLKNSGRKVILTTYQSGDVVRAACGKAIDFAIFDEAHKTAGNAGLFSLLLKDDRKFSIQRRLFMTATERIARKNGRDVVGMENTELYGDYIDVMTFKEALDAKLLCPYQIIAVEVTEADIQNKIKDNASFGGLSSREAISLIAYEKAKRKYGITRAISFHSSVASAQAFTRVANSRKVHSMHINGTMPVTNRTAILHELSERGSVVTNARCLTEGIDVPCIDAVIFADARRSKVDIVQAVGRAIRTHESKEMAYVIVPIDATGDAAKTDAAYMHLVNVVMGLASSDERIKDFISLNVDDRSGGDGKKAAYTEPSPLDRLDISRLSKSVKLKLINRNQSLFGFYTYEELVKECNIANIQTQSQYKNWRKENTRAPSNPNVTYAEWVSWRALFGKAAVKKYSYGEAQVACKNLGICTCTQYRTIAARDHKLAAYPERYYAEWSGWPSFFGKETFIKYSFFELKKACKDNKIDSRAKYYEWSMENKRAPRYPEAYKEWSGWDDFFGKKKEIYTYNELKSACKSHGIKTRSDYMLWYKSDAMAPSEPNKRYKEWVDWYEMLGNERRKNKYSYSQLKAICIGAGITTQSEYKKWRKTDPRIPSNPNRDYKDEWISWPHLFGRESLKKQTRESN